MRRITALTTGPLAVVLMAAALAGCSSSSTSDDAKSPTTGGSQSSAPSTTASAAPTTKAANGHLEYTGKSTGSADFTSGITCEVKAGRLIGVTAPDAFDKKAPKAPLFIATTGGLEKLARLDTVDNQSYSQRESGTVSGHKSGGTWTVTVRNVKIAGDSGGPTDVITVNGSLTCTRTI